MENIFKELGDFLKKHNLTIATSESLTGGLLASSIVDISGASSYFKEGFVTYCDEAKIKTLGVMRNTIDEFGAISNQTAFEMAQGTARLSGCPIAISTTGNAGPICDEGKPAGLVYIGIFIDGNISVFDFHFSGSRADIRKQAARTAAEKCLELLRQAYH